MSNPTEDFSKVGARKLRFLMQTNHLTLVQLSDAIDVGRVTLQELVDGHSTPSDSVMKKICRHFGVPPSYFGIGSTDEAVPKPVGPVASRPGAPSRSSTPTRPGSKPVSRAAAETLTLKSLAVRYQALLELLLAKGVFTAAEYKDQVAQVERRK